MLGRERRISDWDLISSMVVFYSSPITSLLMFLIISGTKYRAAPIPSTSAGDWHIRQTRPHNYSEQGALITYGRTRTHINSLEFKRFWVTTSILTPISVIQSLVKCPQIRHLELLAGMLAVVVVVVTLTAVVSLRFLCVGFLHCVANKLFLWMDEEREKVFQVESNESFPGPTRFSPL